MSRSKRKTPMHGVTAAASEKTDKALSHRRLRRVAKRMIEPSLETPLPPERKLVDPWTMAKEGKIRFDPLEVPRWMRK